MQVVACYEAGYDGFWLHRLLLAHGIASQVVDPASLLVNRRARCRKTDRIDLAGLLRTLMAWHRGEPQVCSMVHVPRERFTVSSRPSVSRSLRSTPPGEERPAVQRRGDLAGRISIHASWMESDTRTP